MLLRKNQVNDKNTYVYKIVQKLIYIRYVFSWEVKNDIECILQNNFNCWV